MGRKTLTAAPYGRLIPWVGRPNLMGYTRRSAYPPAWVYIRVDLLKVRAQSPTNLDYLSIDQK